MSAAIGQTRAVSHVAAIHANEFIVRTLSPSEKAAVAHREALGEGKSPGEAKAISRDVLLAAQAERRAVMERERSS